MPFLCVKIVFTLILGYSFTMIQEVAIRQCYHPKCEAEGKFPAPRLRQMPVSYDGPLAMQDDIPTQKDWYCLEHIRQFNAGWDFFSGMGQEDIEAFYKDAATGHRRTCTITPDIIGQGYHQAWNLRDGKQAKSFKRSSVLSTGKEQKALKILGIDVAKDKVSLKQHYRSLVKLYHPDNPKTGSEEKFRLINEAYNYLMAR